MGDRQERRERPYRGETKIREERAKVRGETDGRRVSQEKEIEMREEGRQERKEKRKETGER